MKRIPLILALATATLFAWAQTPIVEFPAELGTAEYGKLAEVPKELKEASLHYLKEVDGYLVAQYKAGYETGICSFDADMNAFFPPKDWMKEKSRYVGMNDAKQIVAVKTAKKGAEIALLDKQMNVVTKVPINADIYSGQLIANTQVADGKIYFLVWQNTVKPACWMGYVLDAKTLQILSQKALSTSTTSKYTYSKNNEYVACLTVDDSKHKYMHNPLFNGASLQLYDKNFSLIKERYVYGTFDDPWVLSLDEKAKKKARGNLITNGDYHVQVGDDGVLRYVTFDAASLLMMTATSSSTKSIRNSKLTVYTLSADRNDSISISDVLGDKTPLKQTLIKADDDNIVLMAWCLSKGMFAGSYTVFNWNIKTNEITVLKEENKIFPASQAYVSGPPSSPTVLYKDDEGMLVEFVRGSQGNVYYLMWCSADGKTVVFPSFAGPNQADVYSVNAMVYVAPIQSRQFIAHSAATDVSCFLVCKWLNTGFNATAPIENTDPMYLEFINKEGQVATYVFPKKYENVGFGVLGVVKSYKSTVSVTASRIDDTSICLYIQDPKEGKHQWVTLHPALLAK